MKNQLKIVTNSNGKGIQYFLKNESGQWIILSQSSPLSRQYYTNTTISEKGEEIVDVIDKLYNIGNRGIEIFFEGNNDDYNWVKKATEEKVVLGRNLRLKYGKTKIAVLGKKSSGKTMLIGGISDYLNTEFIPKTQKDYICYSDNKNNVDWIELNGIDLGKENVEAAYNNLSELIENGVSSVIYCVLASDGKIEETEKEFLNNLAEQFSDTIIMIALTLGIGKETDDMVNILLKETQHVKIVPILAKKFKSRNEETIQPFGLDTLMKYVFEGR